MADCTYRTNRFKMPLLHFVGSNSIGGDFTIAFCFMPRQLQVDYVWALDRMLQLLYEPINCCTKVFLSDYEDALRSACTQIWPDVPRLLCLWHINKNVQDYLQKHFKQVNGPWDPTEAEKQEQRQKREDFMGDWCSLNSTKTEEQYEECWLAFKQRYRKY